MMIGGICVREVILGIKGGRCGFVIGGLNKQVQQWTCTAPFRVGDDFFSLLG